MMLAEEHFQASSKTTAYVVSMTIVVLNPLILPIYHYIRCAETTVQYYLSWLTAILTTLRIYILILIDNI